MLATSEVSCGQTSRTSGSAWPSRAALLSGPVWTYEPHDCGQSAEMCLQLPQQLSGVSDYLCLRTWTMNQERKLENERLARGSRGASLKVELHRTDFWPWVQWRWWWSWRWRCSLLRPARWQGATPAFGADAADGGRAVAAGGTADSTPDLEPLYPPISSGSQNQQSSCSCSNLTKYQQGARWNQAGAFESKSLPSIPELYRLSYKNHSRCLNI